MNAQPSIQKSSVVLRLKIDKINAQGLCPVVVRVIVDRRTAFHFTSHRLRPDDWDSGKMQVKNRVANSQLINSALNTLVNNARQYLLMAGLASQTVSAAQVIASLGNDGGRDDLYAYWRSMLASLDGVQHVNTLHQFRSDYNKLIAFRPALTFGQVTPAFLREFDQHMSRVLKNGLNTRWKTFKNLKKLFNLARKEKITTLYPFDEYDCPKYEQNLRTYLSVGEVDRIEQLIVSGMLTRPLWIAANYFLLSCYAALRYQDLRAFDPAVHLSSERLVLKTLKTGEIVSVQRHRRLNVVLERLASRPGLVTNQKINEYLKVIGGLAKIDKLLTVHVGRHTFAVTSASLGIPADVVMKLLGHNNIKTTMIYYKITDVVVDQQMSKWDQV